MTRILFALALLAAPGLAFAQSSPEEIRDALVGNTFQGDMGGGGYSSFFAENGTYRDASGSGVYEITEDGVCYPETEFGCYAATVDGDQLEWMQDGESVGTGTILEGNPLGY